MSKGGSKQKHQKNNPRGGAEEESDRANINEGRRVQTKLAGCFAGEERLDVGE